MSTYYLRNHDETSHEEVNDQHPLPVEIIQLEDRRTVTSVGRLHVTDWVQAGYGATSGAHDANDALGDRFQFNDVPARGRILSIKMQDSDDDTLAATIHIFSQPFTAAASDAAFTISAADSLNWVTSQLFDAGTDIGSAKMHEINDVDTEYLSLDGKLYAQLSTTGTPNIASQAVMPRVKLFILPLE